MQLVCTVVLHLQCSLLRVLQTLHATFVCSMDTGFQTYVAFKGTFDGVFSCSTPSVPPPPPQRPHVIKVTVKSNTAIC